MRHILVILVALGLITACSQNITPMPSAIGIDATADARVQVTPLVAKPPIQASTTTPVAALTSSGSTTPSVEAMLNRGRELAEKGEYDAAIKEYTKVRELVPEYYGSYYNLGHMWSLKEDYEKAIANYNDALRIKPALILTYTDASKNFLLSRGYAFFRMGNYEKSMTDCDTLIKLNPALKGDYVYYIRGNVWAKMGEHDKAMVDFARFVGASEEFFMENVKCDRCNVLADIRLMSYLSKAGSNNDPKVPIGWIVRGYALWKNYEKAGLKKDIDGVITEFTNAIKSDPQYDLAHFYRAKVWTEKGNYDKALSDYDSAIRIDSRNAEAYFGRAFILYEHGSVDQAIMDAERAVTLRPNNREYQSLLNRLRSSK